jgi:hypothetical protein
MQVFIVLATTLTPLGISTEVTGVFAHVHQAMPAVQAAREGGAAAARIIRQEVMGLDRDSVGQRLTVPMVLNPPVPAFPRPPLTLCAALGCRTPVDRQPFCALHGRTV